MDYRSIVSGYRERMTRITLFDILYKLQNKKSKENEEQAVDYFGLGILTLLFFFENMLVRNKKTGVRELAQFLRYMTRQTLDLPEASFQSIARTIIETMRPTTGKRNRKRFYNYETGEEELIEYSILKAEGWDRENSIQYYTLDEQGLELIFATKEYFSEFQLSISQMMLRKQLEKGEFAGALRQIDEMQISVLNLKDKIRDIKHEIQRNILSHETFERYKEILEDIHRRLEREHTEFDELLAFVRNTKHNYDNTMNQQDREREAMEQIVRIDRELSDVHALHTQLLYESVDLKSSAIEAAGESLYHIGLTAFNFDQEIARKLMGAPLPIEVSRILIEPFMPMQRFKTWSPLTVFESQMIIKPDEEAKDNNFLGFIPEGIALEQLKQRQNIYRGVVKLILKAMGSKKQFTLSACIAAVENIYPQALELKEFYHFWLILHQRSPLSIREVLDNEEHVFHSAFDCFRGMGEYIVVEELDDTVEVRGHLEVKNMRLSMEEV